MTRETCATCRFFDGNVTYTTGVCRQSPPSISRYSTCWPKVEPHDWCGEHQPVAPAPSASDDYTRAGMAWAEAQARLIGAQIRLGRAAAALDGEDGIDVDLEPFGEAVTEARIANDDAEAAFLRLYRERHHAP